MKSGVIFVALLLLATRANCFGFFSGSTPEVNETKGLDSKNASGTSDLKGFDIDTVPILLHEIYIIPLDPDILNQAGGDFFQNDAYQTAPSPQGEHFKILKDSAKKLGLSDNHADRLARAVEMLNLTKEEMESTCDAFEHPNASHEYGQKVRRGLEEAAIQHHAQQKMNNMNPGMMQNMNEGMMNNMPQGMNNMHQGMDNNMKEGMMQNNVNQQEATNMHPMGMNAMPMNSMPMDNRIHPMTMHKMEAAAKLSGMNPQQTHEFIRALSSSNISSEQADQLQKAIVQHGSPPGDLIKLTHYLQNNGTKANTTHSQNNTTFNQQPHGSKVHNEGHHADVQRSLHEQNETKANETDIKSGAHVNKTAYGSTIHQEGQHNDVLRSILEQNGTTANETYAKNSSLPYEQVPGAHQGSPHQQLLRSLLEHNATKENGTDYHKSAGWDQAAQNNNSAKANSSNSVHSESVRSLGQNATNEQASYNSSAVEWDALPQNSSGKHNNGAHSNFVRSTSLNATNESGSYNSSGVGWDALPQNNSAKHNNGAHSNFVRSVSLNDTKENGTSNAGGWEQLKEPSAKENSSLHNNFARSIQAEPLIFTATRRCGVIPKVLPRRESRVSPGQFPWHAAILLSDDTYICSGTLISESIVLTTASCILNYKKTNFALKVVLGAWNFPVNNDITGLPELEVFAKAAVIHPQFKEGSGDNSHNIGLIRLSRDVDFDEFPHIFPICIIPKSLIDLNKASTQCKLQGWPNLAGLNVRRTQAFLSGADVQSKLSGCPNNVGQCVNGPACVADEGSSVICPGNNHPKRYYQWGIVATNPKCPNPASVIDLETVSVLENYGFLKTYLGTPNPADRHPLNINEGENN